VKLTDNEPFLRDYILERMVEKYAKVKFSPEELKERDIATSYIPWPTYRYQALQVYLMLVGNFIKINAKRKTPRKPL